MTITVPLFVNGEGMRGGAVHHSIEGHPFLGLARTAPRYRFFSVRDEFPALWPVDEGGSSIEGELYDVLLRASAHAAGDGLTDISDHGGWRAYRADRAD